MPSVETSIDWGGSMKCSYRLGLVDPKTWEVSELLDGMLGASVSRDAGTELLESGSANAKSRFDVESWGRIEVLASQGGTVERHAVATLLLVPSRTEGSGGQTEREIDGYSVLKPAADVAITAGSYVPSGANAVAHAADMLSGCTPAPVHVGGEARLSDSVVFSSGMTVLEAVWMLVDAVGWTMQIDGRGEIHIVERPSEPSLTIDSAGSRLLGTSVGATDGDMTAPNRYIAVDGIMTAIATDDDPSSPTSTVSRGRYVDVYDDAPKRVAGESLQAYAERKLAERTGVLGTREYGRTWVPGVTIGDIVRGALPSATLEGDMRIVRQSLEFASGIKVSEECEVLR